LADRLYDKLTGRNAEIIYEFDKMEIHIPSFQPLPQCRTRVWKLQGTVKIRTAIV